MSSALISEFAAMRTSDPGNDERLSRWIDQARAAEVAYLHALTRRALSDEGVGQIEPLVPVQPSNPAVTGEDRQDHRFQSAIPEATGQLIDPK